MSAPVDVLAYLNTPCPKMQQALAAVAELIEAANFARHTAAGPTGYTPGADRRLAAALARVQGGGPC